MQAHPCLPRPQPLTWEKSAAYTLVGATAYRMLYGWGVHSLRNGDAVLVWGGAGGLGSMVIQIVRAAGGRAVTVVSADDKFEYCTNLGVAGCINRRNFDHWGILPHWKNSVGYSQWLKGVRQFGTPDMQRYGMAYPLGITLADYTDTNGDGKVGFGDVVEVDVPAADGFQYVNIHLDYGLEKTNGWLKKASNVNNDPSVNPSLVGINILNNTAHTFKAYADGTLIAGSTDTIYNLNEFKQIRGFGGLVYYQADDVFGTLIYAPLEGAVVKLFKGTTEIATMTTDADGWYLSSFIHNGKATVYRLVLQTGTDPNGVSYPEQTVTVTVGGAVKYGEGNFWIPPMP